MTLRNKLLWSARLVIATAFATFIFLDQELGIFLSVWGVAMIAGVYLAVKK